MKIIIERGKVFEKVRTEVFYRGEARKAELADVASMAQMSQDDAPMFGDLFEETAKRVLGELMIWRYPSVEVSEDAVFEVCPPASWPNLGNELKSAIEVYMVHAIVNRWLYMLGVGAEDFSDADALGIRRVLTKREMPL